MAIIVVQLAVGDYATWRAAFDTYDKIRAEAGFTSVRVYRETDNSGEVLVWNEVADLAKARAQLANPEVAKVMRERGVLGPPRIHVIE